MSKPKLLVITGPTAVGKSAAAVCIASRIDGEIVSADSMQVYIGMDIGTAKSSKADLKKVRHHLIDIVKPNQEYSVALYQKMARQAIMEAGDQKKLPILVGGPGLYMRAAIDQLEFPEGAQDSEARQHIKAKLEEIGAEALYGQLKELDPKAAAKIHPGNIRRLVRALEVIELTGRPFSDFQKKWNSWESIYNVEIIGLSLPRNELYAKIDARVNNMMSNGLVEEVQGLVGKGFGEAITSKQALGYQQVLDYLEGKISYEECIDLIKQYTRNFAKRQLTWLRRDSRVHWMDISGTAAEEIAGEIIGYLQVKEFIV